jgi:hypothetical protein
LNDWSRWRDLYLPPAVVRDLADDGLFRISGNSLMVYSPSRTGSTDGLFKRLKLSESRRLMVAFTSSLDEIAANAQYLDAFGAEPFPERQPFADQIEWLNALVERVEASDDLQLVIRVHPREGANRREQTVSDHLAQLRKRFDRTYRHVRLVWPGEDISSYDLMEIADIGLSAWSSTALEMARFGTPAIVAFNRHTPLPIGDVVHWAETRSAYFELLDELLHRPVSLDEIRRAYRWTHLHLLGCAVDLGDVIPQPDCATLPPFKAPAATRFVEKVLVGGHPALELNYERLLGSQTGDSERLERETLMAQLRRSIWLMCTGADRLDDYRLLYCVVPVDHIPQGCDAVLAGDGNFVEFRTRDLHIRRRSRMIQRLGSLFASHVDQFAPA